MPHTKLCLQHVTFSVLAEGKASISLFAPAFLAGLLFAYEVVGGLNAQPAYAHPHDSNSPCGYFIIKLRRVLSSDSHHQHRHHQHRHRLPHQTQKHLKSLNHYWLQKRVKQIGTLPQPQQQHLHLRNQPGRLSSSYT
jgi:hypothetical protein